MIGAPVLGGRWSVVEVVLGLIDFSTFATYFPTSPNTVFSTVTSSTRSSSTASPELCFRVLWVHCDLPCAHLLPWATSCSPKTAFVKDWLGQFQDHPTSGCFQCSSCPCTSGGADCDSLMMKAISGCFFGFGTRRANRFESYKQWFPVRSLC